ncbi:hypothetical protein FLK61_39530 [Paenalkalicoccus suaedae]|uniref:Uncharacterized protein n=1 Tax=Paenalkalicoccus suaedae TaxID=2592382 RepID=A0A859FIK2_9BACI|nr:hypothetical protein [Paenalkalicoccus suaedae]QKS72708.1 hypothetical protein FLK61_39530 [Paenalkalicoccus suaedae]
MNIIDNRGEAHEWMLVITAILSVITIRKITKLERYKKRLAGTFKPY